MHENGTSIAEPEECTASSTKLGSWASILLMSSFSFGRVQVASHQLFILVNGLSIASFVLSECSSEAQTDGFAADLRIWQHNRSYLGKAPVSACLWKVPKCLGPSVSP